MKTIAIASIISTASAATYKIKSLATPVAATSPDACSPCYEKPPACTGSETSVQITGVTGDFCSPLCYQNQCPKGDGSFTAAPSCVLETQGSSKPTQCALICTPGDDAACPAGASCQSIQGEGICTYPSGAQSYPTAAAKAIAMEEQFVKEINAVEGITWKAAVGAMGTRSMASSLGVLGTSQFAVSKLPKRVETIADKDVPAEFDSAANWPKCAVVITDIRDQSMCGCCWAFGGAEAASDRLCIATDAATTVPLSAQDICFNANSDGCNGGQIDTPWDYIARTGAVTGGQYNGTAPSGGHVIPGGPFCSDFSLVHCHHHGPQGNDPYPAEGAPGCPSQSSPEGPRKCDAKAAGGSHGDFAKDKWTFAGGAQSASGEMGIAKAIMAGGPVETAFTVYTDFANYVSGVYTHVSGGVEGGHAVRIVGWGVDGGKKYWKVANSWNPYWGENGYFRIAKGNNECGIENGVSFSPEGAKWSNGGM
tara:strand:+ start:60 stop:1499 length:1440 start_codon:yes stop_codon:yes gene_type:complete